VLQIGKNENNNNKRTNTIERKLSSSSYTSSELSDDELGASAEILTPYVRDIRKDPLYNVHLRFKKKQITDDDLIKELVLHNSFIPPIDDVDDDDGRASSDYNDFDSDVTDEIVSSDEHYRVNPMRQRYVVTKLRLHINFVQNIFSQHL